MREMSERTAFLNEVPNKYRPAVSKKLEDMSKKISEPLAIHHALNYMQRLMRDDGAPELYVKTHTQQARVAVLEARARRKFAGIKPPPRKRTVKATSKRRMKRRSKKVLTTRSKIPTKRPARKAPKRVVRKAAKRVLRKAPKRVVKKAPKRVVRKAAKRIAKTSSKDVVVSPTQILKSAKRGVGIVGVGALKKVRAEVGYPDGPFVSANKLIKSAKKHNLKTWVCAGKAYRGCGGGKRGGHVISRFT